MVLMYVLYYLDHSEDGRECLCMQDRGMWPMAGTIGNNYVKSDETALEPETSTSLHIIFRSYSTQDLLSIVDLESCGSQLGVGPG
jgi:hypothetical protein